MERIQNILKILFGIIVLLVGMSYGQNPCSKIQTDLSEFSQVVEASEKILLYKVNENLFLQAKLSSNCEIVEIKVAPIQFWRTLDDESKTKASDLSPMEYRGLKEKIDRIRSFGSLISTEKIGIATNANMMVWDRYENAYVERVFYISTENEFNEGRIVSFTILFLHKVKGRINKKQLVEGINGLNKAKVKINRKWYWTNPEEINKWSIGDKSEFIVYGLPIL